MGGLGGNNGGGETVNIDVNQLTSSGLNNTIMFAPNGFNTLNTTFNVTGGNGYTLAFGPIIAVAVVLIPTVINPTTANLTVNGFSQTGTGLLTLNLGGTSTGNGVGGVIGNGTGTTR